MAETKRVYIKRRDVKEQSAQLTSEYNKKNANNLRNVNTVNNVNSVNTVNNVDGLSNDTFEMLMKQMQDTNIEASDNIKFNYCPDCKIPMGITNSGYNCFTCGYITELSGSVKDCSEDSQNGIRMSSGGNYFNMSSNTKRTQKLYILNYLVKLNDEFKGDKLPLSVLREVSEKFSEIQSLDVEVYHYDDVATANTVNTAVENTANTVNTVNTKEEIINNMFALNVAQANPQNTVVSSAKSITKKFVCRTDVKRELLGALLEMECKNSGIPQLKRNITKFMGLSIAGLPRGYKILREFELAGKFKSNLDNNATREFINRYLSTMDENKPNYREFVYELVAASYTLRMQVKSMNSSRVAGAIWVLFMHIGKRITHTEFESKVDNIRKNTWMEFYKAVHAEMDLYVRIFSKWGINHNLPGILIEKRLLDDMIAVGIISGVTFRDVRTN